MDNDVGGKPDSRTPGIYVLADEWFGEPRLRLVSHRTRQLWLEILVFMSQCRPTGHLADNGLPYPTGDLAKILGMPRAELERRLGELVAKGIASKTDTDILYSRRMVREAARRLAARENGRKGGNPNLRTQVNPALNPPSDAQVNLDLNAPNPTRARLPTLPYLTNTESLPNTVDPRDRSPSGSHNVSGGKEGVSATRTASASPRRSQPQAQAPTPIAEHLAGITPIAKPPPSNPEDTAQTTVLQRLKGTADKIGLQGLTPQTIGLAIPTPVLKHLVQLQISNQLDFRTLEQTINAYRQDITQL